MKPAPANQQTAQFLVDDHLEVWVDAWLADCRARNLKPSTIKRFYREKIGLFLRFAGGQAIARMSQITAGVVRDYLNHLEDTGHNPGGRHAAYRALRACLRFWADEVEPDGWRDPFKRARPPKVDLEPLQPVGLETVEAMAAACDRKTLTGARNRAILLALLDTGCRAGEFLQIDLADVDLAAGQILLKQTKGRTPRLVFLGRSSRRAVRAYLKLRIDKSPALWVTDEGERLKFWGLKAMVRTLAARAGVGRPGLHDFRRGCAIAMHRNGADLLTISRYLGHKSIETTKRYLRLEVDDLHDAHRRAGPVDNNRL